MPIRRPTLPEIDALSKYTGEGRRQCQDELKTYFRRRHAELATTIEELREVVLDMLPPPNTYIESALEDAHANDQ